MIYSRRRGRRFSGGGEREPILIPNVRGFFDQSILNARELPNLTLSGAHTLPQSRRNDPLKYNKVLIDLSSPSLKVSPDAVQGACIFMQVNELEINSGRLSVDGLNSNAGFLNDSPGASGALGGGASGNTGFAPSGGANGGDGGHTGSSPNGQDSGNQPGGLGSWINYDQSDFLYDFGGGGGDGSPSDTRSGGSGGSARRGAGGGGGGAGNEGEGWIAQSTGAGSGAGLMAIVGRVLKYTANGAITAIGGSSGFQSYRGGPGGGGVLDLAFLAKLTDLDIFSVLAGDGYAFGPGSPGTIRLFEIPSDWETGGMLVEHTDLTDTWDNR